MTDTQDLISRMNEYTRFLADLGEVTAEVLQAPMATGKWTVKEALAHIMAWDANFLKTVVLPLEAGKQPPIADEVNYQAFNKKAAALGRQLTKGQLLSEATAARVELVEHLQRLRPEAFHEKGRGRAQGDLAEFLERNFVSHDKHHIDQIREYLASTRV